MTSTRIGAVLLFAASVIVASPGRVLAAPAPGQDDAWTGFQVGGHVGGNWSHTTSQTINTVNGASEGPPSSTSVSHVGGGFQAGYDQMMPSRLVVGVFAGASVFGLNDTSSTSIGTNVHISQSKTDWAASAVGRVGYGMRTVMIYGLGGWTGSSGSTTRTQVTGTTGNAVPGTVETLSVHHSGWTAGGGLSSAVGRRVRAFVEYHYSPGSNTNTFPIAQRSTSSSSTNNNINVGVNARF
jgi:opacity protein-like surface antigen